MASKELRFDEEARRAQATRYESQGRSRRRLTLPRRFAYGLIAPLRERICPRLSRSSWPGHGDQPAQALAWATAPPPLATPPPPAAPTSNSAPMRVESPVSLTRPSPSSPIE